MAARGKQKGPRRARLRVEMRGVRVIGDIRPSEIDTVGNTEKKGPRSRFKQLFYLDQASDRRDHGRVRPLRHGPIRINIVLEKKATARAAAM